MGETHLISHLRCLNVPCSIRIMCMRFQMLKLMGKSASLICLVTLLGSPQGMLIAENWIQRISMELNRSPEEIRVFIIFSMKISFFVISFVIYTYSLLYACMYCFQEINFQKEGSILHYGQQIEHSTLDRLWNELKASCKFLEAREKVEQFNAHNRWKKRGISIIPTKFGISFTVKFMNQVVFVFLYLNLI